MKLYHVTRKTNLDSILANGLDPAKAKMRRKSVWAVVKSRAPWAIVHVMSKPWNRDAKLSDLIVIEITIPKAKVRRHATAIYYTCPEVGSIPVTAEMVKPAADFGKTR
jgi:hypothetical protein